MAWLSSTLDESVSPHDVRASETHCEAKSVSHLASLSVSFVRRKKSKRMTTSFRKSIYPVAAVFGLLFTFTPLARAGGPRYIAGISYFNQGTAGVPLTWAQGAVNYYTDQGSLSPTVSGPQGDALVADAFSQWTSISTAAITATHAGQLAEDGSGANVYRN